MKGRALSGPGWLTERLLCSDYFLSGTVSPFRAEQGTSLETPSRARASSCQAVGTTWFFSSCSGGLRPPVELCVEPAESIPSAEGPTLLYFMLLNCGVGEDS